MVAQSASLLSLMHPIRKHNQLYFTVVWIIIWNLNTKIVHAIHALVHHELHRQCGLISGFQDHRTDGWYGGSTALCDFYNGFTRKAQRLIANIG